MEELEFFATCPAGFESQLKEELHQLHIKRVRPLKGGAAFFGSAVDGYRACLWLRCASRVLLVLDRVSAGTADDLYEGVRALPWHQHIGKEATIAVSARGTNANLRNTQFSALKVKDAICDKLRSVYGTRPDVKPHCPDVAVWVSVHREKATISLDFSGESLHRRGYRKEGFAHEAPLKEALAAGILLRAGWDKAARVPGMTFCDPLCGSGTFVIEAAMIASDMAPGLLRDYWGFSGWLGFDADAFDALLDEADQRFEQGLEDMPVLLGFDLDGACLQVTEMGARSLGLSSRVRFIQSDCANLPSALEEAGVSLDQPGFIATNPPYGVRLLAGELDEFYAHFREGIAGLPSSWDMVVITPDSTFDASLGLDAYAVGNVYNGAIEACVRQYHCGSSCVQELPLISLSGRDVVASVMSDHADQFAARLRKVAKQRKKWAKRNNLFAYRVYDADLPDYAVAIDSMTDVDSSLEYLVVSEYQAPRSIEPNKAARRFRDACSVAACLFDVPQERVFTKVRKQDRGGAQYAKDQRENFCIHTLENGHRFELNLSGYLDTGLFLDHRITRQMLAEKSAGKTVLNLFAYTGTATVYAAAGGAKATTTVDLSQTYLEVAKRNMHDAGFRGSNHRFVRANVLEWVDREVRAAQTGACYDVIFVDPPTFSNSKAMGKATWDIQRDHAVLLGKLQQILAPGGTMFFSGNLRSFKLDKEALEAYGLQVRDITAQTIPEDFARNPRIHFCYLIEKE